MTIWIRQTLTNLVGVVRQVMTRRRLLATVLTVAFVVPVITFAQATPEVLQPGLQSAADIGLPDPGIDSVQDVRLLIARAIRFVLGFVGILALGVVLYGGYLWMTAAGDSGRVDEAKIVLRNGLIGLSLIIFSFIIVTVIINTFWGDILNGGKSGNPGFTGCRNCIARGAGLVDDVYPEPGSRVPRDVDILVTFAEPVVVVPAGDANADKSFMINLINGDGNNGCPATWVCGDNNPDKFYLEYTSPDGDKTTYDQFKISTKDNVLFVIDPVDLMGLEIDGQAVETSTEAFIYDVFPVSNPETLGGLVYAWEFTVTTQIDNTPPFITDISPWEGNNSTRDDTIILTFNETINPISVTGVQDADNGSFFDNLAIYAGGDQVDGEFLLGNGYKQVWFVPESICTDTNGNAITNSCGFQKYCLPPNASIRAVSKAATLKTSAACGNQQASKPAEACTTISPNFFDGVVDISKNSLDGSRNYIPNTNPPELTFPTGDGVANGPLGNPVVDSLNSLGDTFAWEFSTNDQVFISPPVITSLSPEPDTEGVDVRAPFDATFNRTLLPSRTYRLNNVVYKPARIYQETLPTPANGTWTNYQGSYGIRQFNVKACSQNPGVSCTRDSDCTGANNFCRNVCGEDSAVSCLLDNDCPGNENKCGQTVFRIDHTGLIDPNRSPEAQVTYEPRIGSTVQDRWQNCFYKPSSVGISNELYGTPVPNFNVPDVNVNQTVPPFGQFNQ
jgi:hypothetical protein